MMSDANIFQPPNFPAKSHISSIEEYNKLYKESIENPNDFWDKQAKNFLTWFSDYTQVTSGSFQNGDVSWFLNGKINVSYNCIDRHLKENKDKVAIIFEGDEATQVQKITYYELYLQVNRLANVLLSLGIKKGDAVAIYLPNTPIAIYSMLACARIGAIHSVIFAGFGYESIVSRVDDAKCRLIITADEGLRGGRYIPLKEKIDQVVKHCKSVEHVLVFKNTGRHVNFNSSIDIWADEAMVEQRPYCPPVFLDSEDPLFILYTSGSTGKPKGLVHTQAGYLLYAAMTHRYVFDYQDDDIYACMADVGWITGHSYIVYGPLANGATTFIFEGTPLHPTPARYWEMVERHKITQFYTAPTAIRSLMKFPVSFTESSDKSSLRVLGSVGEPINPEAWRWFYNHVGQEKCAIVDTYWQTESGGHLISPLPGATPMKPGSATKPFFGIELRVLDSKTGQVITGEKEASGVLAVARPWPGMARTVFQSHSRYLTTYMNPYPGHYFTGDGVRRDNDGYYWIEGRVDDVINVSGHRLGTAELESALVGCSLCAEAAVVGFPHDIKGQGILAFCTLKQGYEEDESNVIALLKKEVRTIIGPFATPDVIIITPSLPKTRSGKIMRRILRKIGAHESTPEQLGDISTLAEPEVVQLLIDKVSKVIPKTH
ncbi:acetyl-CoA synthetase [Dictyostelium purpureum]|uniref:Acetyl-coenzyme A synthetase n=1 Tax=Dictyostelium purpureum TaxID=5786 RepID=F1A288_DICPU|nr:acetyl-CoA synthetase [Dictyostelium purpureum]EGC29700.1 acetyl-CoA synthetase [Dictyostelium purpureum]|eukprot:XP_003293782.1 acetyl-CoA synthetase [Dictyostelium purpureum]